MDDDQYKYNELFEYWDDPEGWTNRYIETLARNIDTGQIWRFKGGGWHYADGEVPLVQGSLFPSKAI